MALQKRYKLRYLPLFWDDLNEVSGYIRDVLHNPQASSRLLDKTEEAILLYSTMPEAALLYHETRDRLNPYRWIGVGNYMVFSVVFDDIMEVRRFICGSRDMLRLLP